MKYYSEILNKSFDSEKACLKAEEDYVSENKKKALQQEALNKDYEDAKAEYQLELKKYETARKNAEDFVKQCSEKYAAMLETAEKSLAQAYDKMKAAGDAAGKKTEVKSTEAYTSNLSDLLSFFFDYIF